MAEEKQKTIMADLHTHTCYSSDGETRPDELVRRARELGLDAIAVTDHNTTKGAIEAKRIAKGKPLVIIGQEVRTKEGEIIILGPKQDIAHGLGLLETCRIAKKLGGFIIIPHPFDKFREGIGPKIGSIKQYIDAVEVYNTRCIFSRFNKKAEKFAKKNSLPAVAGTDAHFPGELGGAATVIKAGKISEEEIFRAIKKMRTAVSAEKRGRFSMLRTCLRRVRKKL
jgi:hypothetical protein